MFKISDRILEYNPQKKAAVKWTPSNDPTFDHIHSESKLWNQMRWAVNNVAPKLQDNENFHLYLYTTSNPDVSRGGLPTCTDDCFGFTSRYLLGNGTDCLYVILNDQKTSHFN